MAEKLIFSILKEKSFNEITNIICGKNGKNEMYSVGMFSSTN